MIRIGFDPMLEAEQHTKQLLKQAEYDRMIKEAGVDTRIYLVASSRLLANLGRQMASVGLRLAERYSNNQKVIVDYVARNPDICG